MSPANKGDRSLEEYAHDAITAEEITGAEPPNKVNSAIDAAGQKRPNACTLHRSTTIPNTRP
jgi:hypothetical protein